MGLSRTIVRVIFSAQKKLWKNPTQKINFFIFIMYLRRCVYVCIYKKRDIKLIISRSRYIKGSDPDPDPEAPMFSPD